MSYTKGKLEVKESSQGFCRVETENEETICNLGNDSDALSNAKRIVHCVNNYDGLVEACKLALRDYKYIDSLSDTPNILRQVIAKTEEA